MFCHVYGEVTFGGPIFPGSTCVACALEVCISTEHLAFVYRLLLGLLGPRAGACWGPSPTLWCTSPASCSSWGSASVAPWQRRASLPALWAGRWGFASPSFTERMHSPGFMWPVVLSGPCRALRPQPQPEQSAFPFPPAALCSAPWTRTFLPSESWGFSFLPYELSLTFKRTSVNF